MFTKILIILSVRICVYAKNLCLNSNDLIISVSLLPPIDPQYVCLSINCVRSSAAGAKLPIFRTVSTFLFFCEKNKIHLQRCEFLLIFAVDLFTCARSGVIL